MLNPKGGGRTMDYELTLLLACILLCIINIVFLGAYSNYLEDEQ